MKPIPQSVRDLARARPCFPVSERMPARVPYQPRDGWPYRTAAEREKVA
jgi:hypothetical protein